MRRFLILALASVGVLIASAILDVGSRASAAYLSTASRAVGSEAGAGASTPNSTPETPSHANYKPAQLYLLTNNQPAGAGTSSSGHSTSNPTSPVAVMPSKELPPGNLVVYFREPATRLELTKYVDSILDPPRQV